jgi:hypothetical protein
VVVDVLVEALLVLVVAYRCCYRKSLGSGKRDAMLRRRIAFRFRN